VTTAPAARVTPSPSLTPGVRILPAPSQPRLTSSLQQPAQIVALRPAAHRAGVGRRAGHAMPCLSPFQRRGSRVHLTCHTTHGIVRRRGSRSRPGGRHGLSNGRQHYRPGPTKAAAHMTHCSPSETPRSSPRRQAAQRATPSPFAVTARPDTEATGAVIRRVRLGWHQSGQNWRYEDVSRDQWEIICRDCGDDEGPPQRQSAAVSLLRRPIVGRTRAQAALQHHVAAHREIGPPG